MKQQAEQSMRPDRIHRLRKEDTATFLLSPEACIQISIREGPKRGWTDEQEREECEAQEVLMHGRGMLAGGGRQIVRGR